jgi:putative ABC transport system substrate-binding protein
MKRCVPVQRRDLLVLLGGAAIARPIGVRAQEPTAPLIGFLSARSPSESTGVVRAFLDGLRETGFVEGQNLRIAYRWAEGRYDRLQPMALELIGMRVSLLFAAGGPPAVFAAKAATSTIPIVFSGTSDPVRLGFVSSLSRPGGNITGMSFFTMTIVGKSFELLRELVPTAAAVAYLLNPSNPGAREQTKEAQAAASALGMRLHIIKASNNDELDAAFAGMPRLRVGGIVVPGEAFFDSQRDRIVALAKRHAVTAICPWRDYVVAGGLISYGSSLTDSYRRAGIYSGRILKGEKPADLPVQQPTKLELVVNLKTARALGLTIPQSILLRADEVIE